MAQPLPEVSPRPTLARRGTTQGDCSALALHLRACVNEAALASQPLTVGKLPQPKHCDVDHTRTVNRHHNPRLIKRGVNASGTTTAKSPSAPGSHRYAKEACVRTCCSVQSPNRSGSSGRRHGVAATARAERTRNSDDPLLSRPIIARHACSRTHRISTSPTPSLAITSRTSSSARMHSIMRFRR
jgi:hypothetical protein